MLQITIPDREYFDDSTQEFFTIKGKTIQLEHSLVAISKWEGKWHKSFLGHAEKTEDEIRDYIKCMTITQHVDPLVYYNLSNENIEAIMAYIADPMTATRFLNDGEGRSREKVTSELIYYWMIALGVPFECQKWHLNRLLTLIKVCNRKQQKPKKMGKKQLMERNNALNAARRQRLGSRG